LELLLMSTRHIRLERSVALAIPLFTNGFDFDHANGMTGPANVFIKDLKSPCAACEQAPLASGQG
jgi:hypothetical protein